VAGNRVNQHSILGSVNLCGGQQGGIINKNSPINCGSKTCFNTGRRSPSAVQCVQETFDHEIALSTFHYPATVPSPARSCYGNYCTKLPKWHLSTMM